MFRCTLSCPGLSKMWRHLQLVVTGAGGEKKKTGDKLLSERKFHEQETRPNCTKREKRGQKEESRSGVSWSVRSCLLSQKLFPSERCFSFSEPQEGIPNSSFSKKKVQGKSAREFNPETNRSRMLAPPLLKLYTLPDKRKVQKKQLVSTGK